MESNLASKIDFGLGIFFANFISHHSSCTLFCRRQLKSVPSCIKQAQNCHSADKPFVTLRVTCHLNENLERFQNFYACATLKELDWAIVCEISICLQQTMGIFLDWTTNTRFSNFKPVRAFAFRVDLSLRQFSKI